MTTPLNRCQQLPAPYKRLINDVNKPTNRPTNNRRIETDQWLLTNSTRVFQPITSRLNRPITFNRPDLITSSTDNYSSLDSEDDYRTDSRNVSHQQQFFSELHTPGRSHYTNYNVPCTRHSTFVSIYAPTVDKTHKWIFYILHRLTV